MERRVKEIPRSPTRITEWLLVCVARADMEQEIDAIGWLREQGDEGLAGG